MTLDELLHPITTAQFLADYDGRKPLHIPAEDDQRKRQVLTWAAFNAMLNQADMWSAGSLRLVRDHQAIPPEQYSRRVATPDGSVMRPWPAKTEVFLSAGASIVANDVMQLHPPLARITQTLGEAFAAQIGANIYCSFSGIPAFGTHFDNHHVFVIHTEGEKVWNIYENRELNPTDLLPDTQDTRRYFQRVRGKLAQSITMRPGDVLYLPRGQYHDALAQNGPSLHVTFSVTPLYGRILLHLLDNAAMQNPRFRDYLPPARKDGGKALQDHLTELGRLLANLVSTPQFRDEVAMAQQRLVARPANFTLPERKPVTFYRTTGVAFPQASTAVRIAYDWAVQERRFALEDMIAHFDFISEADVRAGVEAAVAAGALQKE